MQERTNRTRQNLADREGRIRSNLDTRANRLSSNTTARSKRLEEGLIRDLRNLSPEKEPPTLRREEPRGGIPSARGYAEVNLQPGTGTAEGGIASPLIEGDAVNVESPGTPVTTRTYHENVQVISSDGLLVWTVSPTATIKFIDANGNLAEFKLANPYETQP